jgi:hypothetical protein
VKNVNLTLCNRSCTKVFTLWPRMHLQDQAMPAAKLKSSGRKTTKTGGSDPTFSAFSRPKSSWGRSRPHRDDATVALSRPQATVTNSSKAYMATGLVQSWQC